jgi:hypothetical protein
MEVAAGIVRDALMAVEGTTAIALVGVAPFEHLPETAL